MLRLQDGPAKGDYLCRRAPVFLRAVVDETTGEGDCLDQLCDEPKRSEKVYVYERLGTAEVIHLNSRKTHGFFEFGRYRHVPDVDGEALRDNAAWQAWCLQRIENEKGGDPK